MTNNTAHANCSHPRTKVDRARCRKARALATSRPAAPAIHLLTTSTKTVHQAMTDDISRTLCNGAKLSKAVQGLGTQDDVTCKNCIKRAA